MDRRIPIPTPFDLNHLAHAGVYVLEDNTLMEVQEFNIGDKVVPHSKNVGVRGMQNDPQWMRNGGKEQGYMYIVGLAPSGKPGIKAYQLAPTPDAPEGNHYLATDLTLYEEPIVEDINEPFDPKAFNELFK